MNWTTLVSAEDLARVPAHEPLRLIDARFSLVDPDAGRGAYEAAHLAGAHYADLDRDLSDLSKAGEGRHPLPDDSRFAQALGRWGVDPQQQVVVYDASDGSMAAARLWWLLKLVGHDNVAVLDGGLEAWRAQGLPTTTAIPHPASAAPYPAGFDRARIAQADEVLARLQERGGWLFDARAPERYRGEVEPIDPVAGHVPGAVNRPFAHNLRGGRFKPSDELRDELAPLLHGRAPRDAVLMCGSGVTACHLLLAFEHAGLRGTRVYAGSWSGWISDASRPIACRG